MREGENTALARGAVGLRAEAASVAAGAVGADPSRDASLAALWRRGWVLVAALCILGAARANLEVPHLWRQSDVLGHILGMLGARGFEPFNLFRLDVGSVMYDLPIYEGVIALGAWLLQSDVLIVTRYVNFALWLVAAHVFTRLCDAVLDVPESQAGQWLVGFLGASPLFVHYFSAPLPDLLAVTLAGGAVLALVRGPADRHATAIAAALLGMSTAIKSPVAFVLLALLVAYRALRSDGGLRARLWQPDLLAVSGVCAALAVGVERLRAWQMDTAGRAVFAQDPTWYFGTLEQRVSLDYWLAMVPGVSEGFGANVLTGLYVGVAVTTLLVVREARVRAFLLATWVAYAAGWLVFANLYLLHDYYRLPAVLALALGLSVCLAAVGTELQARGLWVARDVMWVAVSAPLILAAFGNLRGQQRVVESDVFQIALAEEGAFTWVVEDEVRLLNPILGALAQTRFLRVTPEAFERECDAWLEASTAFVTRSMDGVCIGRASVGARVVYRTAEGVWLVVR